MTDDWKTACEVMVESQIVRRGVNDPATLKAMRSVPREAFVPPSMKEQAYDDHPLPIGAGQTISQPYIVAVMTQHAELSGGERVLEIGTGSGYGAAVLAQIADSVFTIERIPVLAEEAQRRFQELGYHNIETKIDDGTVGWEEKAPFDAILVTASAPTLPEAYIRQLKPNGRLVIPIGDRWGQELYVIRKDAEGEGFTREPKELVRFVPLIGEQGW